MAISFNPRTREGANDTSAYPTVYLYVSIHAPVKVRTMSRYCPYVLEMVSIHAPVKVRTVWRCSMSLRAFAFQSTHP